MAIKPAAMAAAAAYGGESWRIWRKKSIGGIMNAIGGGVIEENMKIPKY